MSTTGNVRKNNEDNLLCDGHSRDIMMKKISLIMEKFSVTIVKS